MNFLLNWRYKLAGVYCGFGGVDAVPVMEAMGEGDGGDEKDETLDFLGGACDEEIGVYQDN